MGFVMKELYFGFSMAFVCGLFTIFVENWVQRMFIQLLTICAIIWSIYEAIKSRSKTSDGLAILFMRTFNIFLILDLFMHIVINQDLLSDTYSSLEWFVLVVFGFSPESGCLLNH